MSRPDIDLQKLSDNDRRRFKALTTASAVSWPIVVLWLVLMSSFISVYVLGFTGLLPLWLGAIINSVVGYVAFSIVHDAIHRSISTNIKLNDFFGQSAVLLVAPYVNLKLFRWGHILHHRFANGEKDPDQVMHGPAWSLPLRWAFIDVLYLRHAVLHGDKISAPLLRSSLKVAALVGLLFVGLIAAGYGWQLFWLWLIPSRVIQVMLGFSFFWLPHVPHDTSQADNFTRATSVRVGYEWLLGPALQNQNYHLIHHIYPSTPFYNNRKVWQLLEPQLRQYDLAIHHGFAIQPTIYPASKSAGTPTL